MFSYLWPVILIVLSNVFYQISTKSVPEGLNPYASLLVTYLVGAASSVILYYALGNRGSILKECVKVNWAAFALGLAIVGLEVGYIYAYQAGWAVSILPTVQAAFLAIVLVGVGFLVYREAVTLNKIIGLVVCLAGLYILNK